MIGFVMTGFYSRLSRAEVREVGWIHTVVSFTLGWGAGGFSGQARSAMRPQATPWWR